MFKAIITFLLWYHRPQRILTQFERRIKKLENSKKFHDQYKQWQQRIAKNAEERARVAETNAAHADAVAEKIRALVSK